MGQVGVWVGKDRPRPHSEVGKSRGGARRPPSSAESHARWFVPFHSWIDKDL